MEANGEVCNFSLSKISQQDLFQHTYICWYCRPSSPDGKQMNALPDIISHKQFDDKIHYSCMFHGNCHWIYDKSGYCMQGQHQNEQRTPIEDTAKYIHHFFLQHVYPWLMSQRKYSLLDEYCLFVKILIFVLKYLIHPFLGRLHE